ncbi:MAG: CcmD family protein [Thermoflavifilum sp.]|nr:CcmD family protein [Thermoflavifilum sp.]
MMHALWLHISAFFLLQAGQMSANAASSAPEMATLMRSNGKIYVVVAVIVIIWIGLLLYVISVDRKLHRIEKKFSQSASHQVSRNSEILS